MPSKSVKSFNPLSLKQAANWQCDSCGRVCRHQGESLEDFATRMGHDINDIVAHPRRWTLHVTKRPSWEAPSQREADVLCGSCHRTYHNYRRWQQQQQQAQQHKERWGQLTLGDIRLPLTGLQLSLSDSVTPYEIVNPLPARKRTKSKGAPS